MSKLKPVNSSTPSFLEDAALISERDIWMAAGDYIERHSEFAAIEASKQADYFLSKGDLAGQRVWQRVVKAITSMTEVEGETPN